MNSTTYTGHNRAHWDKHAQARVGHGRERWKHTEPVWGQWARPDAELGLLPETMEGLDAIELGCGTAYISGWMARRGATVVGVDNSARQLELARRFAEEHGVELELIHGIAESVPKPDESFDFVVSEYGAAIWSDPYIWIPEAWRLLRSGGQLVILGNHPLLMICLSYDKNEPAGPQFLLPYFGIHRLDWHDGDDTATNFNLTISDWMALFIDSGFEILAYHELRAPDPGSGRHFNVTDDWAHHWPAEQVWKLRKH